MTSSYSILHLQFLAILVHSSLGLCSLKKDASLPTYSCSPPHSPGGLMVGTHLNRELSVPVVLSWQRQTTSRKIRKDFVRAKSSCRLFISIILHNTPSPMIGQMILFLGPLCSTPAFNSMLSSWSIIHSFHSFLLLQ